MKYRSIFLLLITFTLLNSNRTFAEDATLSSYYEIAKQNCYDITSIRAEMDRINNEILELLTERTAYVQRAGDLKSRTSKIADDRQRVADQEEKIINKSRELKLPVEISVPAFRVIMETSIKFQQVYIDQLVTESKEKTLKKSVSPVSAIVLKEVVDILSNRFNTQIQVGSIIQLSEQERRNLILRINIQSPSAGVPKSVILKQALPAKLSDDSNKISGRFARDWAGLEFLSTLKTGAPPVPKFYGGSLEHGFILIEDLGEKHISLVDSLTGDNAKDAEIALLRFMIDLGKLHASSYSKTEDYFKILKKVNPSAESWQDNLQKTIEKDLPALKLSLKSLNIVPSEEALSEMNNVFKSNLAPGPFTTLIHGDICPDNVFYNREKNELYLIDFEWSFVKNALLDGTYLRMSFPTCWCAKAIPNELIHPLETSYRKELNKTIPAARSDEEYHDAYVNACAFWMLKSLLLIEVVLEKEDIWSSGPTPPESLWNPEANLVRPRVLSRLISFIEISKAYKKLPHLLSMAEEVLKELAIRWPDAKQLEQYPAFSKFSTKNLTSPSSTCK